MSRLYQITPRDADILWAVRAFLRKTIASDYIRPAQIVTVAKLLHVFSVLPQVTEGVTASLQLVCPRRHFGHIETQHWWEIEIQDDRLCISSGGHIAPPITGGRTFTTMTWDASPERPAELHDYREALQAIPDLRSFFEGVESIDFGSAPYSIHVYDDDNPLLKDEDNLEGERHDHHCAQCGAYWGCKLGEYCHLPTELLCPRHGTDYEGGWYFDADVHFHECRECAEKDGEFVDTFDWGHSVPQCRMPRFWACEKHRGIHTPEPS